MKKATCIIVLITLLLIPVNALAYEIVGAYLYTNVEADNFNALIDDTNNALDNLEFLINADSIDYADQINDANGFYFGLANKLTLSGIETKITGTYERFSMGSSSENTFFGDERFTSDLDLTIQGFVVTLAPMLNDYLSLNAAIGYYNGDGRLEYNKTFFGDYGIDNFDLDLEGSIGFKLGASLNYNISDNLSLNTSANYRFLEMDVTAKEDYGENGDYRGFIDDIFAVPSIDDIPSKEDFSGFEATIGLNYSF